MALKTVMRTVWAYEERKSSKGRCVKSTRCREGLAFGVKDGGCQLTTGATLLSWVPGSLHGLGGHWHLVFKMKL